MNTVTAELVTAGYSGTVNYVVVQPRGSPVIGVSPNFMIGLATPHIDWNIQVQVSHDSVTGQVMYFVSGNHDGVPLP